MPVLPPSAKICCFCSRKKLQRCHFAEKVGKWNPKEKKSQLGVPPASPWGVRTHPKRHEHASLQTSVQIQTWYAIVTDSHDPFCRSTLGSVVSESVSAVVVGRWLEPHLWACWSWLNLPADMAYPGQSQRVEVCGCMGTSTLSFLDAGEAEPNQVQHVPPLPVPNGKADGIVLWGGRRERSETQWSFAILGLPGLQAGAALSDRPHGLRDRAPQGDWTPKSPKKPDLERPWGLGIQPLKPFTAVGGAPGTWARAGSEACALWGLGVQRSPFPFWGFLNMVWFRNQAVLR